MELSILKDVIVFGYSILLGGALSLIENIFFSVRTILALKKVAVCLLDILFFALAGIIIFIFSLEQNFGIIRWYIWIGVLVGFFVANLTLGQIFKKMISFICTKIKKFFMFLIKRINVTFKSKKTLKNCKKTIEK